MTLINPKEETNMKKDVSAKTNKSDKVPVNRRPHFFTPWFDDIFDSARWVDDFFSRNLSPLAKNLPSLSGPADDRFLSPTIDIDETSNEYIVTADLPGIKKDDIRIECSANQLTLSAERKYESSHDKKSNRRERYYGTYQRSFSLPMGAEMDKVEATYEGGVLCVRIPKGEQAKSRRIQIEENKEKSQETSKH